MSDLSSDNIGLFNYSRKSEWRRALDREIRSEGYDLFNPNPLNTDAPMPPTTDAITLLTELASPSGRRVVIAGTRETIWKYSGFENGSYYESGVVEDGYFDENPGAWTEIGSGFSKRGNRWECEAVGSYLVLNNGVDLPVSYRVQDSRVTPIHELREQGIASIGTIGRFSDVLVCGDVRQINAERHQEIMSATPAALSCGQTGIEGSLGALATINSNGIPAQKILVINNFSQTVTIKAKIDGNYVNLGTLASGSTLTIEDGITELIAEYYNGFITQVSGEFIDESFGGIAVLTAGLAWEFTAGAPGVDLIADAATFNGGNGFTGMAGRTVRMMNGLERTIASVTSPTHAILSGSDVIVEPAQPFFFPDDADTVLSQRWDEMFPGLSRDSLIGLRLFWDSGEVRTITDAASDGSDLTVDDDSEIPEGPVSIENPLAYAEFSEPAYVERFHARIIESMPGEPRRFAAIIPGTATASSKFISLSYPVKSLESGQEVTLTDAGENGETLRTEILWAHPGIARVVMLADEALPGLLQAKADAISAEDSARIATEQAKTALTDAHQDWVAAKEALSASPEDADLIAAVAAASAKLPALTAAVSAANDAWEKATANRKTQDAIALTADTLITRTDAVGSIVSYDDLDGDGSGIVRIIELRGYLVVAKETGFFVGRYVGKANQAFSFEEIKEIPREAALRHKWTMVNVSGQYLLYAGLSDFFTFDLVTRVPKIAEAFQACRGNFFDSLNDGLGPEMPGTAEDDQHITFDNLTVGETYQIDTGLNTVGVYQLAITDAFDDSEDYDGKKKTTVNADPAAATMRLVKQERVFAAQNPITGEVWFCFDAEADNVLRFDTQFVTVSTSTLDITSAATVRRPASKSEVGKSVLWFAMGGADGSILRYGLTNEPVLRSGSTQASSTVAGEITTNAAFFTPTMVGKTILLANGKCVAITGYSNPKKVTVLGSTAGISGQTFKLLPAIWHRDGDEYDSVLESGMESFGSPESEKRWTQHTTLLSSQQSANTPMTVGLRQARNTNEEEDAFTATVESPLTESLVTLILVANHVGDRITVSGKNNPCELVGRSLLIGGINTQNFNRRRS